MSRARSLCTLALSAVLLFATKGESFATFVPATPLPAAAHGSVWFVPEVPTVADPSCGPSCDVPAVPMGSVPSVPADLTFTTSIINFSSYGTATNTGNPALDFTINSFLNSLGAVPLGNQTYSPFANPVLGNVPTPGTALLGVCAPAAPCDVGEYGTFIEITGDLLLTTGDHIKIAHDDGVTLKLNGVLVPEFTAPLAPASLESFIYLGPSGLIGFDLTYAESVTDPAFLQLAVPEPGTIALFATSLVVLSWLARRRHA